MDNDVTSLIRGHIQAYQDGREKVIGSIEEEKRLAIQRLEEKRIQECSNLAKTHLAPVCASIHSAVAIAHDEVDIKVGQLANSLAEVHQVTDKRSTLPTKFYNDEHVAIFDGVIEVRICVQVMKKVREPSPSSSHTIANLESTTVPDNTTLPANDNAAPLGPVCDSKLCSPEASGTYKRTLDLEEDEDTIAFRPRTYKRPRPSQWSRNTRANNPSIVPPTLGPANRPQIANAVVPALGPANRHPPSTTTAYATGSTVLTTATNQIGLYSDSVLNCGDIP